MNEYTLNRKITSIKPAASIALSELAKKMKSDGADIINLSIGEPDFDTPVSVCNEAFFAMMNGKTHYTTGKGIPALRTRIAEKLNAENGISCGADNILITPGAKYAIFTALITILNPGDEVLVPVPAWLSYQTLTGLAGGTAVDVPLSFEDGYRITEEKLEAFVSERTKAIIVCNPSNPTGRLLEKDELEAVIRFALRHDLFIISDEIYEKLIYGGKQHFSFAAFPEAADRVITINGFSKCAAMTGWRLGYLCADKKVVDAAALFYQHTMTCVSEFAQNAAIKALDSAEETEKMRLAYEKRCQYLTEELSSMENIEFIRPDGAFYVWMRFKNGISDPSRYLLEKAGIVAVPGSSYAADAADFVRLSYAVDDETLKKAVERLRRI